MWLLTLSLTIALTQTPQTQTPSPTEGDFVIRNFTFTSGEALPELKIHYRTYGTPRKDAQGIVRNAVLIMHGTGGTGAQFAGRGFAGELFGPGQPLDTTRYFIILPDDLGHGRSSKPSDGLRATFPRYGYVDMVTAEHRLVSEGLGVSHLRLVMGTSMGGMHTWMWGAMYPDFMDALLPLASLPTPIAGRNRAWRRVVIDAIRGDPEWQKGNYATQPQSLRTAAQMLWLVGSNPIRRQTEAPTVQEADRVLDAYVANYIKSGDANDILYALEASRDYDPGPSLEKIKAPLLAINSADDIINPPELQILEKAISRVPKGRVVVLPLSDRTAGHGTHTLAALWKEHLVALLAETEAPSEKPDAAFNEFWTNLRALCGGTFEGKVIDAPPADTTFAGKRLVMHVRQCGADEIRIPLHVGDDTSRTWVLTRTAGGLRLKHDHRHDDGTEDKVSQYGGDARKGGSAMRQEFPADAHTITVIPEGRTNVWTIEMEPGRTFVYALRREGTDRRFRFEFDTTRHALPSSPLHYGFFTIEFVPDGAFTITGKEWAPFKGTWKAEKDEVTLVTSGGPKECMTPGRYRVKVDGAQLSMTLVADDCGPRRMVLKDSTWRSGGEGMAAAARKIVRTAPARAPKLPVAAPARGSWPSFRGPGASGVADGQHLPEHWNGKARQNILWHTPIPGLAHSSPVVWGNRVFVTSAVSSKGNATFKPGLYGDGDSSDDRSRHKWMLYAIDKRTGNVAWERVASEQEPRERRHIKSTYASASPATDGRIVVAWFGSQGVHAFDVNGNRLWAVDLGRIDVGAYDIPSYEWGPASSPIIWNGLVLLQCDTQTDSFVLALDARTGKTVWKTDRQELPSWGTPTVVTTAAGDELVTNASNFIRGYDPRTGKELWRLGGSSKITAPTPFLANGLVFVSSGRNPEKPLFGVRPGSRGDLTLAKDQTSNAGIAWSKAGRGSYMPTPIAYQGILYVLTNNGVFDTYEVETGKEIYRQRLTPVGSGFSASPVAADGRIYLTSEDGEILVIGAGREFKQLATNSMGELVMATPALSDGVMYVRSSSSLFAIGAPRK